LQANGKIDVCVNNAGYGLVRTLEHATIPEIQQCFDVDFYGVVRFVRRSSLMQINSDSAVDAVSQSLQSSGAAYAQGTLGSRNQCYKRWGFGVRNFLL